MSKIITMDRRSRIVIPKDVRDAAKINMPTKLLAITTGNGRIELIVIDLEMKTARSIATRKFARWREGNHEADSLAFKLLNE
jgi:bifunctional DNA-binding transcriptional regulator/antitoxin component of YhaV-PrlF toxin-antitoxin module